MIKIHYFRFDKNYQDLDIWVFSTPQNGQAHHFQTQTPFGMVATLDLSAGDSFIIRHRDWLFQEKTFVVDTLHKEYFVVTGRDSLFFDLDAALLATTPAIYSAFIDDYSRVKITLTTPPPPSVQFYLRVNNKLITGTQVEWLDELNFDLILPQTFTLISNELLEICASSFFKPRPVILRKILDDFAYDGADLGYTRQVEKDVILDKLKIWTPTASEVEIFLYKKYDEEKNSPTKILTATFLPQYGLWISEFSPQIREEFSFYLYRLTFYKGTVYEYTSLVSDPYAKGISIDGKKSSFVLATDDATLPIKWEEDERPFKGTHTEAIIYEVHTRDFSIHESSAVSPNLRGKFLAFTEENTKLLESGLSTCLDHLAELGISHIHLLPINDFASVADEDIANKLDDGTFNRNWGYDPRHYQALEGSYVTNPYLPSLRLKEFRELVKSLHSKKIGVIVDVVFNHLYKAEYLDAIVPFYYFRTYRDGTFSNGSGVGNELASERKMVRKLIIDTSIYLIEEFHLDGLRFDLMALLDCITVKEMVQHLRKIYPNLIIYGEPWTGGISSLPLDEQTLDGTQKEQNFAFFNDRFRDAIRGSNGLGRGFVNGGASFCDIYGLHLGIKGSIDDFTVTASETINYLDVHDNHNLFDHFVLTTTTKPPADYLADLLKVVSLSPKEEEKVDIKLLEDCVVRRILLALAILLCSQGSCLLQGGTEFLRTKQGEHNSYCSSDEINEFVWKQKEKFYPFYQKVKDLIRLRKSSPLFTLEDATNIHQFIRVRQLNSCKEILCVTYDGSSLKEDNFVFLVNPLEQEILCSIEKEDEDWRIQDENGDKKISSFWPQFSNFSNGKIFCEWSNLPFSLTKFFDCPFTKEEGEKTNKGVDFSLAPLSAYIFRIKTTNQK